MLTPASSVDGGAKRCWPADPHPAPQPRRGVCPGRGRDVPAPPGHGRSPASGHPPGGGPSPGHPPGGGPFPRLQRCALFQSCPRSRWGHVHSDPHRHCTAGLGWGRSSLAWQTTPSRKPQGAGCECLPPAAWRRRPRPSDLQRQMRTGGEPGHAAPREARPQRGRRWLRSGCAAPSAPRLSTPTGQQRGRLDHHRQGRRSRTWKPPCGTEDRRPVTRKRAGRTRLGRTSPRNTLEGERNGRTGDVRWRGYECRSSRVVRRRGVS